MANFKRRVLSAAVSLLMFGTAAGTAAGTACVVSQPITASAYSSWGGYNSPTYIKAKSGLNMRTGAGTNYKKITAIPYGTWVTTTRLSDNGWAYVTYKTKKKTYYGWIFLNNAQYAEVYLD